MKTVLANGHRTITRTAVAATSAGLAVIALASPASADRTVANQDFAVDCGGGACEVQVPFTMTDPLVKINATQSDFYCARSIAFYNIDGRDMGSQRVGGGWQQAPVQQSIGPGNHTLRVTFKALADCKDGVQTVLSGRIQVDEVPRPVKTLVPQAPGGGPVATVPFDTDVYDAPDGTGTRLGSLEGGEGQTVALGPIGCRPDQWCQIVWPQPPDLAWTFFGPQ